jgi:hypothetical protein
LDTGVDLRISKRLLWIGTAAYPLQNIARVYTFTLRPRRKEAALLFLKRAGLTVVVAMLVSFPGLLGVVLSGGKSSGFGTFASMVWFAAFGIGIYCFVDLMNVLAAPSHYVLAVETSGASTGLVTSRHPQYLDQLVGQISHAIDHPDTEFQVRVDTISISPNHYYFGDNVNMYGGNGNVGMAA